jgi:hypothetical protein
MVLVLKLTFSLHLGAWPAWGQASEVEAYCVALINDLTLSTLEWQGENRKVWSEALVA